MKKPPPPLLILALAVLLPGMGQVANREPVRGLIFVFFMLLLGAFTALTATPDVSVIGKYAGGIFVYAMSLLDAYKRARLREEVRRREEGGR
jgi:hypothetical protein